MINRRRSSNSQNPHSMHEAMVATMGGSFAPLTVVPVCA